MSKLIIIRGPSGAGKSTLARQLFERTPRPTALVGRDHYMFMFKAPDEADTPDKELLEHNIGFCLDHGFDVIFEGNYKVKSHQPILERLFAKHPQENYIFYLDVSLDETLKRHSGRAEQLITAEEIKGLYKHAEPLQHASEVIIPEHSSLEASIALIRESTGI